jgi:hypothetical protein
MKGQLQILNDKLQIEELAELREINRINEVIANDPIMSKLKKSFEKTYMERRDRTEKLIKSENKNPDEFKNKLERSAELDKLKQDKARRNLFELKNLSKEELEKRRLEDLFLIVKDINDESINQNNINLPKSYKLEQNYPNPFNPTTTISYEIPKDEFVKIKVYDIIGRELFTLVNELKQAGSYKLIFD